MERYSRSVSGRESSLFLRSTGSPIKVFGDDEEFPVVTIKERGKGGRNEALCES
jgi:hypothetical protein